MAVLGTLEVQPRSQQGSRYCRKLRTQGIVPGNVYGHNEAPEAVTAPLGKVVELLKSGARVIDVKYNDKVSKALLREVQWDSMGDTLQHFNLMRVDPNEKIHVDVHVELKGTAPGVFGGGVLDHVLRTVQLECSVSAIPEAVVVKIGNMEIGHVVHVSELEIPAGTRVLNHGELVVVRIAKAKEEVLVVGEGGGPVAPEIIGKKPTEEGDEKEPAKKK